MKLSFVWNFHDKIMGRIYSNIFWHSKKKCVVKTREMFSFLSVRNNSFTFRLSFLWLSISAIISSNTINVLIFLFGLCSFYVFSGDIIKVNYFLPCLITLYSISSFLHYRLLLDPYAYVFIESIDYIIIFNFSIFLYFVFTCFICICFYSIDWL